MYKRVTIFLLTLAGVQVLAKVQVPFQNISLLPVYELEAELQTPLAVPAAKFSSAVSQDCRDFSNTMLRLRAQSIQIQNTDYDEIRFRALPLSMKPQYEVRLLAEKSLNLEPAFELAKIAKFNLEFSFSKDAVSFSNVQKNISEYVTLISAESPNYFAIHFKSRDLFCDYYFGNLKINLNAQLELQLSQALQVETEGKLKKILDSLNDGLKMSESKKIQAAYLGLKTFENSPKKWKEDLKTIFNNLVSKEDLLPNAFWSEQQSNFYVLNFSRLHNISEQKIFLKGKFYE